MHLPNRRVGRMQAWLPKLALLGIIGASLSWSVQSIWDPRPDAARYILVSQSLTRGLGFTIDGEPFTLRPPGMAVLLALPLYLAGVNFTILNLWGTLFGIVLVLLLYDHLRARVGDGVAAGAALLVWFNPALQRLANLVMSDVPGVVFALLALRATAAAARSRSVKRNLFAGVAIAAAIHVRTSNVALFPAVLIGGAFARRRTGECRQSIRNLACCIGTAAILCIPWFAYSALHPPQGDLALSSYTSAYSRADAADPKAPFVTFGTLAARVRTHFSKYVALIASQLERSEPVPGDWAIAFAVSIAWIAVLRRNRAISEWFAPCFLAMLLPYYVYDARLVLPVFVMAVAVVAEGLHLIGRQLETRLGLTGAAAGTAALGLCIWAGPHLKYDFMRDGSRQEYVELQKAVAYVLETSGPGESLGGDLGPIYGVLLGRPVRTLRGLRSEVLTSATMDAIAKGNLDVVIVRNERAGAAFAAQERRIGEPVQDFGMYLVIRLRHKAATSVDAYEARHGTRSARFCPRGSAGRVSMLRRRPLRPFWVIPQ